MYNYSVIIPYRDKYNLFLKAVASIPDREDIQIIIADNAVEYLSKEEIPTKNKALVTYCQSSQTKGAGCARNEGLKHVKGRYVLFVDADDYFTETAFDAFDKYLDKEYDIVFFKSTSIKLKNGEESDRHIDYNKKIDKYLKLGNEDLLRCRYEAPWGKLYKTDFLIINQFKFEEVMVGNDAWFSLQAGFNAHKISASNNIVYCITESELGQSLVKIKSRQSQLSRYKGNIRINKFLKEHNKYSVRVRLLGHIKEALFDFGIKEMAYYIYLAIKNKVTIF